jgi:putative ABC transport system ATP-binding protein/lipoprotein-releasing system ATP-binding protein
MIDVRNVTKRYRAGNQEITAVDDVSFRCEKGEYVSIIGHSGSGKTTFLSLIGGLTRPDDGDIVIDGTSILSLDDDRLSEFRNRKLNFVFQFSSLIPTLTAIENVMLPVVFSPERRNGKSVRDEAMRLLEEMGLGDKINAYPSQLSGGQQRRVAIARAFINNPEIILADEPTGDLDEETEADVIRFFKRLNQEKGITFIVVTHSTTIANEAKRVLRMHNGKLVGSE